jgi:hypothetical protein
MFLPAAKGQLCGGAEFIVSFPLPCAGRGGVNTVTWLALGSRKKLKGWRTTNSLAVVTWMNMCRFFSSHTNFSADLKS